MSVEPHHIDAWKDRYVRGYESSPERLNEFLDVDWPRIERDLPSRFPAYSGFIALDDGTLWVKVFERPGEAKEWHVFNREGDWIYRLEEPQGVDILDISPTAVLARVWRVGGVETLEVRELTFSHAAPGGTTSLRSPQAADRAPKSTRTSNRAGPIGSNSGS